MDISQNLDNEPEVSNRDNKKKVIELVLVTLAAVLILTTMVLFYSRDKKPGTDVTDAEPSVLIDDQNDLDTVVVTEAEITAQLNLPATEEDQTLVLTEEEIRAQLDKTEDTDGENATTTDEVLEIEDALPVEVEGGELVTDGSLSLFSFPVNETDDGAIDQSPKTESLMPVLSDSEHEALRVATSPSEELVSAMNPGE